MEGAWAAIRRDAHGLTTHPGLLGGATSGARVAISQTSRLVQETRRAQVGVLIRHQSLSPRREGQLPVHHTV